MVYIAFSKFKMATEKENCPKQDLLQTIFTDIIYDSFWEIISILEQFSDRLSILLKTYVPTCPLSSPSGFWGSWCHQEYFALYHINVWWKNLKVWFLYKYKTACVKDLFILIMTDTASLENYGKHWMSSVEEWRIKNAKLDTTLVNVLCDNKMVAFVMILSPRQKYFHSYWTEAYKLTCTFRVCPIINGK